VKRYPDAWELYDIEADRSELNNVVDAHPDVVKELSDLYDEWAARCMVASWDDITAK
jgi:arylsulfatase